MNSQKGVYGSACALASVRAQKKQAVILSIATELFLERGYDAVSLDDILQKAGGSKTTLYTYYGGKEGLFAATVQKLCHDKLSPFLAMNVDHLSPQDGLTALGRQFLTMISDSNGCSLFRAMIAEAQRFPELAATFFASGPEAVIRVLQRTIEHWQRQKLLRQGNAEAMAIQFIGLIMGNFHLKSLLGLVDSLSEGQIHAWVDRGVELFLEGALPRKG